MLIPFQGKTPLVSPEAFVAETATLIGDVTVGRDSSVWYGAVIRGTAVRSRSAAAATSRTTPCCTRSLTVR